MLNHYYNINENTSLNTSLYASYGKGVVQVLLDLVEYGNQDRTDDGLINWDTVVADNVANDGGTPKYGLATTAGSSLILRNSVNNHRWYRYLQT